MSALILTTGLRTKIPYHISVIDRNVYSYEELAYSLVQSAQFLDESIMDPELLTWLSDECSLPDLAKLLKPFIGRGERLADFVGTILGIADYIPIEKQEGALQVLRAGEGLEQYEQKEAKADYLMDTGHFYQALTEYEKILAQLPEPERRLRARIEHSRGIIYCGLFRFAMAAECLHTAADLSDEKQYYIDYLSAVRMYLPDADYVNFIAGHPEAYEASLEVERRMDDAHLNYENTPGNAQIAKLRRLRGGIAREEFLSELSSTIREMRDNYRTNLGG